MNPDHIIKIQLINLVHILIKLAFGSLVPLLVNVGIHPVHINGSETVFCVLFFLLFLLLIGGFASKVGD